ncbi:MAG: ABC transporter permease [Bdellovibrionales bacterium]
MTAADINFAWNMARSGWLAATRDRGARIAMLISYAVITLAFGFLLYSVDFKGTLKNAPTAQQMVWYFLTIEIVLMTYQSFRSSMVNRIYTGQTMFEMGYPRPLWQIYIPYMMGAGMHNALLLTAGAFVIGSVITQAAPPLTAGWVLLPYTVFMSILLYTGFTLFLVFATLRWRLGNSFQYMLNKFFFLLGGIVVPPILFPGLWGEIIPLLPFNAFLFGGAMPQLWGSSAFMPLSLLLQPLWLIIFFWTTWRFARRTMRRLQESGEGS